jgi:2-polyprenyl-3-methyl-5-hydroxy-6-metoxy-1,4-benzoquinol methylase
MAKTVPDRYLEKFYNERAFFVKEYNKNKIEKILKMFKDVRAEKILDIGCGDGTITKEIADTVGAKTVVGVDLSKRQLSQAKKKGVETHRVNLNKEKIPLKMKFDLIVCIDVIEHIFDPDHLLDEVTRLSKPEGYQLFSTPNFGAWYNRLALLIGWQPFNLDTSLRFKGHNPMFRFKEPYGHIRLFTKNSLIDLLKNHGLNVVRFDTANLSHESLFRNIVEHAVPFKNLKSFLIFLTEKR